MRVVLGPISAMVAKPWRPAHSKDLPGLSLVDLKAQRKIYDIYEQERLIFYNVCDTDPRYLDEDKTLCTSQSTQNNDRPSIPKFLIDTQKFENFSLTLQTWIARIKHFVNSL